MRADLIIYERVDGRYGFKPNAASEEFFAKFARGYSAVSGKRFLGVGVGVVKDGWEATTMRHVAGE
jgi:hypothetical protein